MSARGVLRTLGADRLGFWCPGCETMHVVGTEGTERPRWDFNGDFDRPTFSPSVLVQTGRAVDPKWVPEEGDPPEVCHSSVRDGAVPFLGDCAHAVARQAVPLRGRSDPQGPAL